MKERCPSETLQLVCMHWRFPDNGGVHGKTKFTQKEDACFIKLESMYFNFFYFLSMWPMGLISLGYKYVPMTLIINQNKYLYFFGSGHPLE